MGDVRRVFSDVRDIPCANIFRFQRLLLFFGKECRLQMATLSREAPPVCRT